MFRPRRRVSATHPLTGPLPRVMPVIDRSRPRPAPRVKPLFPFGFNPAELASGALHFTAATGDTYGRHACPHCGVWHG